MIVLFVKQVHLQKVGAAEEKRGEKSGKCFFSIPWAEKKWGEK